jgi:predicted Zn-dependent peptidase
MESYLDLQKLAICEPRFNEGELIAEKGNVRSELTGYLNNYNRLLGPRVQQLLGEDVLTYRQSLQTINNVTLADVREHHRRTHTTKNLRFIIAGKLKGRKAEIKRQLSEFSLPEGDRLEAPHDILHKANPVLIRRKDATNLTFGMFMVLSRQLTNQEQDAVSCLNHILTGTTHSRIFGKARQKGLAYNVSSYIGSGLYDSGWDITGQVNHESVEGLFDIIVKELKRVLDGRINASDIKAAQSFALGRYQMGAQTVSQISNFYTSRYFADGFIENYEKVPEMIKNVTVDCMVETARQFIGENKWVLAAVRNCEKSELAN